jgi:hypothetical protein
MVLVVELDDNLEIGIEVGSGTPDPQLGALGFGADRVPQEVDEAPALQKRPPDVIEFALRGRRFASWNRSQSDQVKGHLSVQPSA